MGVFMGYHLGLAGASITFFVRPARLDGMKPPQVLYNYDDAQLKTYSDYQTITTVAEVAAQRFDYVLVTFDGATCRSTEGAMLLSELGDAVRPTLAAMIIGGVGIGLREHYLKTTQLPQDRLLEGTLGALSYQVQRVNLPLHSPVDPAQLAKASMAYHHFPNKVGFMLASHPARSARAFAKLYDRCGVSRCSHMNVTLYKMVTNVFFPMTAVCDLAGWPDVKGMTAHKPLLTLCSNSMKDIMGLAQHGWIGKLMRLFFSEKMLVKVLTKLERDSLPLDFHAFNRFHHGGKVRAQDIQVMRHCAESGESQGQSMAALKQLLQLYETHCKQQGGA